MQAVVFDRVGLPRDVLRLGEIAVPEASDGEVVVKVMARPIQPADLAFARGQYRIRPVCPQTAGLEGAGIVIKSSRKTEVPPGTRVSFRWPGSWAEFAAVPIASLIQIPDDVADDIACQISLNPISAWGVLTEAKVGAGDCILLTAAASTVANLIAAMARGRGIRVVGIVRGDAVDGASRSGADEVFSSTDPDLIDKIKKFAGERGVAALLDSVGGRILPQLFDTLCTGANVVAYGVQDPAPAAVTNAVLVYSNLTWKGFGIDRWVSQLSAEAVAAMRVELWSMIRDGSLALPIASRHPLNGFGDALESDARPERRGKVLLV